MENEPILCVLELEDYSSKDIWAELVRRAMEIKRRAMDSPEEVLRTLDLI